MKQILKLAAAPMLVIGGVLAASVVRDVASALMEAAILKDLENWHTNHWQD